MYGDSTGRQEGMQYDRHSQINDVIFRYMPECFSYEVGKRVDSGCREENRVVKAPREGGLAHGARGDLILISRHAEFHYMTIVIPLVLIVQRSLRTPTPEAPFELRNQDKGHSGLRGKHSSYAA